MLIMFRRINVDVCFRFLTALAVKRVTVGGNAG
jgi:hypothetical protein